MIIIIIKTKSIDNGAFRGPADPTMEEEEAVMLAGGRQQQVGEATVATIRWVRPLATGSRTGIVVDCTSNAPATTITTREE